jgi:hypothetical protein
MSLKIVVILSKTFEEITEQEQQTEIIDTDIAADSVSADNNFRHRTYLFSQLLKNYE